MNNRPFSFNKGEEILRIEFVSKKAKVLYILAATNFLNVYGKTYLLILPRYLREYKMKKRNA